MSKELVDLNNLLLSAEKYIDKESVEKITGGLKNRCYKFTFDSVDYFVKKYNPDTQFAYHLSQNRCLSEFRMCEYLLKWNVSVPEPVYCDSSKRIGIYKFIDGQNLFDHGELDFSLIKKIIDELVDIHKVPVCTNIWECSFYRTNQADIQRYLLSSFEFLKNFFNVKLDFQKLEKVFEEISIFILTQPQVFGNMQMHNGNIIINENTNITFVDFEKAPQHFPQMDLISFLNARNSSLFMDFKVIDYYLDKIDCYDKQYFYTCYDLLFVIDNLRSLIKIKHNVDGVKYRWDEINGIRSKHLEATTSETGKLWNLERKESIDKRINNIFTKVYSKHPYCNLLRDKVLGVIENDGAETTLN